MVSLYSNISPKEKKVMWSRLIRSIGSLEEECGVCWATLIQCFMRVRGEAFQGSTVGGMREILEFGNFI